MQRQWYAGENGVDLVKEVFISGLKDPNQKMVKVVGSTLSLEHMPVMNQERELQNAYPLLKSTSSKSKDFAARRKKETRIQTTTKSGAAKPTYVSTDKPKKKMKEENIIESDKKGKGSGTKDACYHKVKSRYSVSNALHMLYHWSNAVKKGALTGVTRQRKKDLLPSQIVALESIGAVELNEKGQKCWKGYEKRKPKKCLVRPIITV